MEGIQGRIPRIHVGFMRDRGREDCERLDETVTCRTRRLDDHVKSQVQTKKEIKTREGNNGHPEGMDIGLV